MGIGGMKLFGKPSESSSSLTTNWLRVLEDGLQEKLTAWELRFLG